MDLTPHRFPDAGSRQIWISDYASAGQNDGATDAATPVASAISAAITDGSYLVHTGAATDLWYVSSFSNIYGVEFTGAGSILVSSNEGNRKILPNFDRFQTIFGREYLSHFHKRIMAGTACKIVCSGDSITNGYLLTAPYVLSTALPAMATKYGITGITGVNSGFSGEATDDWLASHLANDLALNPDLYTIWWGVNDDNQNAGHTRLTFEQTVANFRTGLATIRAAKTTAQMSVVLMVPAATNRLVSKPNLDKYYYRLILALKQAARDYQCVFFDAYTLWWDCLNASDWMDDNDGFTDVGHVHPDDVKQMWINSYLSDILYPTMLRTNG